MTGRFRRVIQNVVLAYLTWRGIDWMLKLSRARAMKAFRRAVQLSPAYACVLSDRSIEPTRIRDVKDFEAQCPILGKQELFGSFKLQELATLPFKATDLENVVTSSGHGGLFAFGLTRRRAADSGVRAIDIGLDQAFNTSTRETLLINCLPMGVTFRSNTVTVANTSVREDMVVAVAKQLGPTYDQIIIVGDPLFLKRVCDYSRELKFSWKSLRLNVVLGEETFSESYRNYLASRLSIDIDDPAGGYIGSSMGVAELGLNLFFETRETTALRRMAYRNEQCFKDLFGCDVGELPLPFIFGFNPLRTFVEISADPESDWGNVVITDLDTHSVIPLVRYRTGDIGRFIDADKARRWLRESGCTHFALPMVALTGRDSDRLKNGSHLLTYKEALYRSAALADCLTGAFRLEQQSSGESLMHIQLNATASAQPDLFEQRLNAMVDRQFPSGTIVKAWSYEQFPYGTGLDYQRKFRYLM